MLKKNKFQRRNQENVDQNVPKNQRNQENIEDTTLRNQKDILKDILKNQKDQRNQENIEDVDQRNIKKNEFNLNIL